MNFLNIFYTLEAITNICCILPIASQTKTNGKSLPISFITHVSIDLDQINK